MKLFLQKICSVEEVCGREDCEVGVMEDQGQGAGDIVDEHGGGGYESANP